MPCIYTNKAIQVIYHTARSCRPKEVWSSHAIFLYIFISRLENFRNEICQFLSENDGNKIIHEHYVGTEIEDETEVMYDVPPADGILENLSVDLPDVGSACQLDYYVANKQDVCFI